MGILDTGAFTIHGGWDVFDRVRGIGSKLREAVVAADDEDYPISFHQGGGLFQIAPHFAGGKDEVLAILAECDEKLDEVCLLYQRIMESAPDLTAPRPDSREIGTAGSNGLMGDIDAILAALDDYKARQAEMPVRSRDESVS